MFVFVFRSLKPDDSSPQLDPPSSFDILDFCYTILIGTFDFLRRSNLKDSLHVCLQLNNSICEIIDLFVKHNYGIMNVKSSFEIKNIEISLLSIFSLNITPFYSIVYIH